MLSAALVAVLVARGTHPLPVAVLALALWRPVWFLAAAAAWGVIARLQPAGSASPSSSEAAFFQGVASELASGASLRWAVVGGAARAPELPLGPAARLAAAGRPHHEVAEAVSSALPVNGRLAGAALRTAAGTGGRSAEVFGALAVRAAEAGELVRERRAATAQARVSLWVVGGVPLAALAVLAASGRLGLFLDQGPAGRVLLALGLGLELSGLSAVWWMLRRHE